MQSTVTRANPELDQSHLVMTTSADYVVWFDEPDSTWQRLSSIDHPVQIVLFDSAGVASATVNAELVRYFDEDRRFVAEGAVVIETSENRRLETEWLEWRESERMVRTPRFVAITAPDEEVRGVGLVAAEDLSTYQIGRFEASAVLDQ